MTGSAHTQDARGELARLRSRAWGPSADIDGDPAALARLRELEGVEQSSPAGLALSHSGGAAASSPGEAEALRAEHHEPEPQISEDVRQLLGAGHVDDAKAGEAEGAHHAGEGGTVRQRRRAPSRWLLLGAGAFGFAMAMVIAFVVPMVLAPSPYAALRVEDIGERGQYKFEITEGVSWLGADIQWGPPTLYREWGGLIPATISSGDLSCLALYSESYSLGPLCGSQEHPAVVQILITDLTAQLVPELPEDIPLGSLVTFVSESDEIQVFLERNLAESSPLPE